MKDRDFFDDRYFEISTRLDSLRAEVAEDRRAIGARREARTVESPATGASRASETDGCEGERRPSRQPA